MSESKQGRVALSLPGEYVEWLRTAVLIEVRSDADISTHDEPKPGCYEGVDNLISQTTADLEMLRVLPQEPVDEFVLWADADALAFALETMAQDVVLRLLMADADVTPLDEGAAAPVRKLVAAFSWAVDHAAECHTAAGKARQAKREAERAAELDRVALRQSDDAEAGDA